MLYCEPHSEYRERAEQRANLMKTVYSTLPYPSPLPYLPHTRPNNIQILTQRSVHYQFGTRFGIYHIDVLESS